MVCLKGRLGNGGVPCVSAVELECYARDMIYDFDVDLLTRPCPVDMERMLECYMQANLEIRSITPDQSILGVTMFNGGEVPIYCGDKGEYRALRMPPRTVLIDRQLAEGISPGRFRFTMAHEAAHLACHAQVRLSSGGLCRESNGGAMFMCRTSDIAKSEEGRKEKTPEQWLEWQADYLAGAILMPARTIYSAVDIYLQQLGMDLNAASWKEMLSRREPKAWITRYISYVFKVSIQAASVRLITLCRHYPLRSILEGRP